MKKLLLLLIILTAFSITAFLGIKVHAQSTGLTISSSFDSTQVSVAQNDTFTAKVRITPSQQPANAQFYRLRINFIKEKLNVTTITYSSPWVLSAYGGDNTNTTGAKNTVNTNGFMNLTGEIQAANPLNLPASPPTELVSITFKAIQTGSSTVDVIGGLPSSKITMVNQDYTVSEIPISGVTPLSVISGVVSTPTPTPTPPTSTGLVVYELRATNPPACVTAVSTPPDNSQISFKGRPGTVTTAPGITRTGFWVNISANSNFGSDYYQVLITDSRSPASIPPDTSWSVRLRDFNHVSGSGQLLLSPATTYYFRVTTNGAQHYFGGDIALGQEFTTAPSFTVAQCSVSPTPTTAPGVPSRPSFSPFSQQCISGPSDPALANMALSWTVNPTFSGELTVKISEGNNTFSNPFTRLITQTSPTTSFSTTLTDFENSSGTRLAIKPGTSFFAKVCLDRSGTQVCGDFSQPSLLIPACSVTPSPTGAACTQKPTGDVNVPPNGTDLLDFNIWRNERFGRLPTQTANFNCSTGGANGNNVDDADFQIWFGGFGT